MDYHGSNFDQTYIKWILKFQKQTTEIKQTKLDVAQIKFLFRMSHFLLQDNVESVRLQKNS